MNAIVVDKQPLSHPTITPHPSESMSSGAAPVLIDVRTAGEFEAVHIPEALNIPLPELHRYVEELKISPGIILFCSFVEHIIV